MCPSPSAIAISARPITSRARASSLCQTETSSRIPLASWASRCARGGSCQRSGSLSSFWSASRRASFSATSKMLLELENLLQQVVGALEDLVHDSVAVAVLEALAAAAGADVVAADAGKVEALRPPEWWARRSSARRGGLGRLRRLRHVLRSPGVRRGGGFNPSGLAGRGARRFLLTHTVSYLPVRRSILPSVALLVLLAAATPAGVVAPQLVGPDGCGIALAAIGTPRGRGRDPGLTAPCRRQRGRRGRRRRILDQLHPKDGGRDVELDAVEQFLERLEGLVLVLDQRVLLSEGAQPDALLEVLHLGQVADPLRVDGLEHDELLDLPHHRLGHLRFLRLVRRVGVLHQAGYRRFLGLAELV